jgi:hypothetical protein
MDNMVDDAPIARNATPGAKFSDDIMLLESFLKQFDVEYDESELEQTPYGKGLRIKRNVK